MANEEKIRILDEQPAENAGSLLYIRTLAGSSDASKPTSMLANGSVFIETDTGKVFIFDEDNGWTEMQAGGGGGGGEKFIVTLTPTALDYSGTMDKTVDEINSAYEAGQEIWFSMDDGNGLTYNVFCDDVLVDSSNIYPSFGSKVIVVLMNALVYLFTGTTNDGTTNTYSTSIYALTPAS